MAQHELSDERFFIAKNKNWSLYYQHIARYLFAKKFVEGKLVLDVACGTGYGTAFLADPAFSGGTVACLNFEKRNRS